MTIDTAADSAGTMPPARTIQEYIDERPTWPDGTAVPRAPMTGVQWRIWWLAAIGKFFEGYVVFATGVALPLIYWHFSLSPMQSGLVGAAPLAGILIGATAFGGLADAFGRKPVFIIEMVLFALFTLALSFADSLPLALACLLGMGMALGADYPTAHMMITESIPSHMRGRLVLSAFGFQALGAVSGIATGFLVLTENPDISAWRTMYLIVVAPAALVVVGRFFVPESAHWLLARGRTEHAEQSLMWLLARVPHYPTRIMLASDPNAPAPAAPSLRERFSALFGRRVRRATLLASLPWFFQDLSTYGIGIFTPTIIAATLGHKADTPHSVSALIHNDLLATKGAALIDTLLIVGIVFAVCFADRIGRIRLQVGGFIGCAVGLALAASSDAFTGTTEIVLIFAGFMLFNFMTNVGPNAQTYLLAGEVFPTRLRGAGAGFAASAGKVGAVLAAFLLPILLHEVGRTALLTALVATSLLGAAATWWWRIETTGIDLEKLHAKDDVTAAQASSS